jgi:hypothetical protein
METPNQADGVDIELPVHLPMVRDRAHPETILAAAELGTRLRRIERQEESGA